MPHRSAWSGVCQRDGESWCRASLLCGALQLKEEEDTVEGVVKASRSLLSLPTHAGPTDGVIG